MRESLLPLTVEASSRNLAFIFRTEMQENMLARLGELHVRARA